MNISPFMLIGATLLLAGPALAGEAPVPPTEMHETATDAPHVAKSGNVALVKAAQAKFAWNLIEHLSKEDNDSTISPASLASAFSLLAKGSNGEMKAAIAASVGFDAGDLAKNLTALSKARAALASNDGAVQSAEKIVIDPESAPPRHLAARLKKQGIEFVAEDLSQPEAVARIDDWVKTTTKGAIPEILGEPLDKGTFAVINALHFKAQWKDPFDPARTAQSSFQNIDGATGDVAMMHLSKAPHAYRTAEGFVGVDLPFANERYSLVVVTTTEKPAKVADFTPVKDWLSGEGFEARKGDVLLPRFKLSGRFDLLPTLDALGLDKGRHSPKALAHFGQGSALSRVVQRAMIEVDEEGATAAAATAVLGKRAVDDSLHMVVDKPFIFALLDRETGLVLVAGYVGHAPAS
jgi:serine protease inhibitor